MKKLLTLLAVLLVSSMPATALTSSAILPNRVDEKLHKKCLYPTVQVMSNSGASGSGIIVRSDRVDDGTYHNVVVTSAHVVRGNKGHIIRKSIYKDWSTLVGYREYQCIIYSADRITDLAVVVFISNIPMPTVELDFSTKLYIGNKVLRFGYGLGEEARLDRGEVTALKMKTPLNTRLNNTIRISINTVPGDSGSGVFHNYKVIAITKAIKAIQGGFVNLPVYHMAYSVPIGSLKEWDNRISNRIDFAYDKKSRQPTIPYFYLKIMSRTVNIKMKPSIWD